MSIDNLVSILTTTSAVSSGVMAGVYLAFSTSVMGGLRQRPDAEGIAAMNAINDVIQNPLFLGLFLGSAASCTALAVTAAMSDEPLPWLRIGSAAVFVVGSFVVTVALNVPLNDKLAAVDAVSAHGAAVWQEYLGRWTSLNHVRTATSALAAVGLTVALRA
jgi:uncharacterized membrane protein